LTTTTAIANNNNNNNNIFDFQIQIDQEQTLLFLCTNKSLDRELVQSIELEVIASDRDPAKRSTRGSSSSSSSIRNVMRSSGSVEQQDTVNSATLRVLINVADINDNAPKFDTQVYNLEFDEGLAPNTELLRLSAHDPDAGANGDVRYDFAILNDEIRDTFHVHAVTGVLVLKRKLDYDRKKFWQLSIRATDQSPNAKSSIALVNLRVNDVNNNKPDIALNFFLIVDYVEPKLLTRRLFDKDTVVKEEVIYLSRALPKDTVIGVVVVADKDAEWNGFIDTCELNLINQNDQLPLYLEEFKQQQVMSAVTATATNGSSSRLVYSSDASLNSEIESMLRNDFRNGGGRSNNNNNNNGGSVSPQQQQQQQQQQSSQERKYFLRTALDFNGLFDAVNKTSSSYLVEIHATDKGKAIRLTGKKDFHVVVLNTKGHLDEDYLAAEEVTGGSYYYFGAKLGEEEEAGDGDVEDGFASDKDNRIEQAAELGDEDDDYEDDTSNNYLYGKFSLIFNEYNI
jgi:hypothetical protein